jgi:eukaryotic-like serine/threonine-protein kinase
MLAAGTTLGPYRIVAALGAGGMGEVYRAHDSRLGRDVAIKVLPPRSALSSDARARFEREARTISQLSHPHICTLFDVGREGETEFLVMELLEGETLAHRVARGALPVADVLRLGAEIASALDRAHAAGVVHRDLKPGNVMLTKTGAKLMDFGLARVGAAPASASGSALSASPTMTQPLTSEGAIIGTFQYMAPEQLEGKDADARADIWALGCVVYEMATGKHAFAGESQASLIAAIMTGEPRAIGELQPLTPPALGHVVTRCLAKDPADRWQSARDVAIGLEMARGALGATGRRDSALPTSARFRIAAVIVACLAVVASAYLGHAIWGPRPAAPPGYERLTFRFGSIDNARFASDGRTVVYDARWEGQPSELFTLRAGSPESRSLGITDARLLSVSSKDELAIQLGPRISGGYECGTLGRVPLGGGAPRSVVGAVWSADWAPDGDKLATAINDSVDRIIELPLGTVLASGSPHGSLVRMVPDGPAVVYWSRQPYGGGGNLELVRAGAAQRRLCPIDYVCTGMAWNRARRELWYSDADTAGATSVYAVSIGGRRRLVSRLAGWVALQDIGPDGRVLMTVRSSRKITQVLAPGSTAERNLSWLDGTSCSDLSGDGRTLVFHEESPVGGRASAVFLRNTNGSPAVHLSEGRWGALSPDGQWVAVYLPGSRPRIRVVPVGAGAARDLDTGDIEPYEAQWFFPDGRSLLFNGSRGGQVNQLFVVSVEGGTPREVTPPGWVHWKGERPLSPDGGFAVATRHGESRMFPTGGGPSKPVPGLEPGEVVLGWTGNGRALYVFRRGDVPARIYRIDVDTGGRQLWREVGPADRAGATLIPWVLIAPDERSYAYTYQRVQDELYLVAGLK